MVSEEENRMLMDIPIDLEIKEAIQDLHSLKSLKPNGFQGIFFKKYWNEIKLQIIYYM